MSYSNCKYWEFFLPCAGILFTLSFAPFEYSYLIFLSLMILFCSWQNISAGRAALRGYLFGLGAIGTGLSWVYISMHDYGGASALVSGLLTALFVSFWALFPAFVGLLSVKWDVNNKGILRFLLVPAIWVLVEYFRGAWVLNGFPWLQIGYTQLASPLAGYIPIFGIYGLGFITALIASIAVEILKGVKKREFLLLLLVLWGAGRWLQTINWTYPIGKPITVTMIQGNIAQNQKWLPENKANILSTYRRLTEAHWGTDLIIWPETAVPAFLDQVKDSFIDPLKKDALLHNSDLIVSVPVQETDKSKKYNAVITLGKEEGIYRKIHLLPFGEYQPLQPLSSYVLEKIRVRVGNFTPGQLSQPLLKAVGYPFVTLICYEDAFGVLSIRGMPDAAFLVNVTNDGWFGNSIEAFQHMQMAKMRAMETGRFLLRSTNTGITAIVSPKGQTINEIPPFTETVLNGIITPMGGMTPYAYLGDIPVIAGMFMLLVFGLMKDERFLIIRWLGRLWKWGVG